MDVDLALPRKLAGIEVVCEVAAAVPNCEGAEGVLRLKIGVLV